MDRRNIKFLSLKYIMICICISFAYINSAAAIISGLTVPSNSGAYCSDLKFYGVRANSWDVADSGEDFIWPATKSATERNTVTSTFAGTCDSLKNRTGGNLVARQYDGERVTGEADVIYVPPVSGVLSVPYAPDGTTLNGVTAFTRFVSKSVNASNAANCDVTYFLPDKYAGDISNGVKDSSDNSIPLSKPGVLKHPDGASCAMKSCDSLTVEEIRAVNDQWSKDRNARLNNYDVSFPPYKKFCNPTTDGTPNGPPLYCHKMTSPQLFPWVWTQGQSGTEMRRDAAGNEVYHCKLHQCAPIQGYSQMCVTNFYEFYNRPKMNAGFTDAFGLTMTYEKAYERDVLRNSAYETILKRESSCSFVIDSDTNSPCNKLNSIDSNVLEGCNSRENCLTLLRNMEKCDKYASIDNALESWVDTNIPGYKSSLTTQVDAFAQSYDACKTKLDNEATVDESKKVANCIAQAGGKCVKTKDCGIEANKTSDECLKAQGVPLSFSEAVYLHPIPHPRAVEIVCQRADGRMYGKYFYARFNDGDEYLSGSRDDLTGVTQAYLDCVAGGGVVKTVLKRSLFGKLDEPLHEDEGKSRIIEQALGIVAAIPLAIGCLVSDNACTLMNRCLEPNGNNGVNTIYSVRNNDSERADFYGIAKRRGNPHNSMFCGSSNDFKEKYEAIKVQPKICGSASFPAIQQSIHYDGLLGLSYDPILTGTYGSYPNMVRLCDPLTTNTNSLPNSAYACGNSLTAFGNKPEWDSYYIKDEPRIVWDTEKPQVTSLTVTACMRFQAPIENTPGHHRTCGVRTARVDCGLWLCETQYLGNDVCRDVEIPTDGTFAVNEDKIGNGTYNDFRFKGVLKGRKGYVILERTTGGLVGRRTTYFVNATSSIDDLRDLDEIYKTCDFIETFGDNDDDDPDKKEPKPTETPMINDKYKFPLSTRLYCRDGVTDITRTNTCDDGAAGSCYGDSSTLQRKETTLEDVYGKVQFKRRNIYTGEVVNIPGKSYEAARIILDDLPDDQKGKWEPFYEIVSEPIAFMSGKCDGTKKDDLFENQDVENTCKLYYYKTYNGANEHNGTRDLGILSDATKWAGSLVSDMTSLTLGGYLAGKNATRPLSLVDELVTFYRGSVNYGDFRKPSERSYGITYSGRLSAISLYDDNSLEDNNCDGIITDEDVFGEEIFREMNCAYMFDTDTWNVLDPTNGDGTYNYIEVPSDYWCKKNSVYVRDSQKTPYQERMGRTEYDQPPKRYDGNGKEITFGQPHTYLVNEKCAELLIHKLDAPASNSLDPMEKHGTEDWEEVDVVQYIGNNQPQGEKQCNLNSLLNCRGFYDHTIYTDQKSGFVKETQGITLPLPVAPDLWWRYGTPDNMPDLFLPILELFKYQRAGGSDYFVIYNGEKTITKSVNFFTPSVILKYNTTEQMASNATTITFDATETTGSIATTYRAGGVSQDLTANFKFKKYGQTYPIASGIACLMQVAEDGTEQQIGCLSRGTPSIRNFVILADNKGTLQLKPYVRAFFHSGDNLGSPTIGNSKSNFLSSNLSVSDVRSMMDLVLTRYHKTTCDSLPTIKDPYAYLNAVENPKEYCQELEKKLDNAGSQYIHLPSDAYAYNGGYPMFLTASYCHKLHYECVGFVKTLQGLMTNNTLDVGLIEIFSGRVRNCQQTITTYCNQLEGVKRTVQLDEDVKRQKLTFIKENYLIDPPGNEICASTGFETYYSNNINQLNHRKVLAIKLSGYYPDARGNGKCVLEERSKNNANCRLPEYYVYCGYTEGRSDPDCKPLADIKPTRDDEKDLGRVLPDDFFCDLSQKNCIKRMPCTCTANGSDTTPKCTDLPPQCFKEGSNFYKASYKGLNGDSNDLSQIQANPSCECRLIDENNMDGLVIDTAKQELRDPTPRELGLCAPLNSLDFCEPNKFTMEDGTEIDGGAGNDLKYITVNKTGNLWRTYQKVNGIYYSIDDLGHTDFGSSNVCAKNNDTWNKTFCLQQEQSYNKNTGTVCPKGGTNCNTALLVRGECKGFWKEKEGTVPLAECTFFKKDGTGKLVSCVKGSVGCSDFPILLLIQNTECERYSCPNVYETEVYVEEENEMEDYSESVARGKDSTDKRGMKHGYATWREYKKGADLTECLEDDSCEFVAKPDSIRTYQVKNTFDDMIYSSSSRTGVENGHGDDIEEVVAVSCVQGFSPAGSNVYLREFLPAKAILNSVDKMAVDTTLESNMQKYVTEQTSFMNSVLGYDLGYYDYIRVKSPDRKLTSRQNYKKWTDLTEWDPLQHLPVRNCNQIGDWDAPLDIYNLHKFPGYWRTFNAFESGIYANSCAQEFSACKKECLEDDTKDDLVCANECQPLINICTGDTCTTSYNDCLFRCPAGDPDCKAECGAEQQDCASNVINGMVENLTAYPHYIPKYCERLYCPGYGEEYIGLLSIESCTPTVTDKANKTSSNCSMEETSPQLRLSLGAGEYAYTMYFSHENNYENYPSGLFFVPDGAKLDYQPAYNPNGTASQVAAYEADDQAPYDTGPERQKAFYANYNANPSSYSTPRVPVEYDSRGNTQIVNKSTIWRQTGGATWPEAPVQRNVEVASYITQGKCFEEKKFYTKDTLFFSEYESQLTSLLDGKMVNADMRSYANGANYAITSCNSRSDKCVYDLAKIKQGQTGQYLVADSDTVAFLKDPNSGMTQPKRSCGKWGQWGAIKDSCLSTCEPLDPFRTSFKDGNHNGFLENWEISDIFLVPRYKSGKNWWRNGFKTEKRTVAGFLQKAGKICKTPYCSCDTKGIDNCDGLGADGLACVIKGDPSCTIAAGGIEDIDYTVGFGDYITKTEQVPSNGRLQLFDLSICTRGVAGCACNICKNDAGELFERVNATDCPIDETLCSTIVQPNLKRVVLADLERLPGSPQRVYNNVKYGDRYTGGAKWPKSLGGVTIRTNPYILDGQQDGQYVRVGDRIYVKGSCFSKVGQKVVENSAWVEGFPYDGATFVQTGNPDNAFEGAPYRECTIDGTWGPVNDPCINFMTCPDFTVTTKNILQYEIDTIPSTNIPLTQTATGYDNGGAGFNLGVAADKGQYCSCIGKTITNCTGNEVVDGLTRPCQLRYGHAKFDLQLNPDGSEVIQTIGNIEGGKLNLADIKNMIASGNPSEGLEVAIDCSSVNSAFMEETGYVYPNATTTNPNPSAIGLKNLITGAYSIPTTDANTSQLTANLVFKDAKDNNKNRRPKVARKCDVTTGQWKPGYSKFECRMKACGDVVYAIGNGTDRIRIVDYRVSGTKEGILVKGESLARTAGDGVLINNITGLFYPKQSGYQGPIDFGRFVDKNRQVFENYEFQASCPVGYTYCEWNETKGEMECDLTKKLKFVCDFGNDNEKDTSKQPIWKRTGECVAQSCIWENDMEGYEVGTFKLTSPTIPSTHAYQKALNKGTSLPWTGLNMVMPYDKFNYSGDIRYYGGPLNSAGGSPTFDSFYRPHVEKDLSIANRQIITNTVVFDQYRQKNKYNYITKANDIVDESTTKIGNYTGGLHPILSRRSDRDSNAANPNDFRVLNMQFNLNPPISGLPYLANPLKKYDYGNNVAKRFTNNVPANNVLNTHYSPSDESPASPFAYLSGTYLTTNETNEATTILNTGNDNKHYFIYEKDNRRYTSGLNRNKNLTDTLGNVKVVDALGRVTAGTKIRMDAYCVRSTGRYREKDSPLVATCEPITSKSDSEYANSMGGLNGKWTLTASGSAARVEPCIQTCSLSALPLDNLGKYYTDFHHNASNGELQSPGNTTADHYGFVPIKIAPKSSGDEEVRRLKAMIRSSEIAGRDPKPYKIRLNNYLYNTMVINGGGMKGAMVANTDYFVEDNEDDTKSNTGLSGYHKHTKIYVKAMEANKMASDNRGIEVTCDENRNLKPSTTAAIMFKCVIDANTKAAKWVQTSGGTCKPFSDAALLALGGSRRFHMRVLGAESESASVRKDQDGDTDIYIGSFWINSAHNKETATEGGYIAYNATWNQNYGSGFIDATGATGYKFQFGFAKACSMKYSGGNISGSCKLKSAWSATYVAGWTEQYNYGVGYDTSAPSTKNSDDMPDFTFSGSGGHAQNVDRGSEISLSTYHSYRPWQLEFASTNNRWTANNALFDLYACDATKIEYVGGLYDGAGTTSIEELWSDSGYQDGAGKRFYFGGNNSGNWFTPGTELYSACNGGGINGFKNSGQIVKWVCKSNGIWERQTNCGNTARRCDIGGLTESASKGCKVSSCSPGTSCEVTSYGTVPAGYGSSFSCDSWRRNTNGNCITTSSVSIHAAVTFKVRSNLTCGIEKYDVQKTEECK